jgi:hypothetical protein
VSNPADEYAEFEQEAADLLGQVGDDAEGTAYALLRRFRKLAKEHPLKEARIRERVRADLLAEQVAARKAEAAFRRHQVPEVVRPLFAGIDLTDEQAVQAKVDGLRAMGVRWGDSVAPPPAPPAIDPNLLAQQAMQQAEAGANAPGGGFEHQLERMAANPGDYSDAQRRAAVDALNARVRSMTTPYSSGALG